MAELLIKAVDYTHPDPVKDARASYKRGMPVVVMPDGHEWGAEEGLPKFVLLKIPGVSVAKVRKYIEEDVVETVEEVGPVVTVKNRTVARRRLWTIRWAALPLAARNKLRDDGELTIAAGTYAGPRDYTWTQIKTFIRNQRTGLNETEDLD